MLSQMNILKFILCIILFSFSSNSFAISKAHITCYEGSHKILDDYGKDVVYISEYDIFALIKENNITFVNGTCIVNFF